jgi:protein TonB
MRQYAVNIFCLGLLVTSDLFGAAFDGRVQDKDNQPVSGAKLTLCQPPCDQGYEQVSAEDGGFLFDPVPDGEYLLHVDAGGFELLLGSVKLSGPNPHSLTVVLLPTDLGQDRKARGGDPALHGPNPPKPARPDLPPPNIKASRLVHKVEPTYPTSNLGRSTGGTVTIAVLLRKDGRLDNLVVLDAPNSQFALSALLGVRQWRYTPTYLNDQPTEVNFTITVNFKPN